MIRSIERAGVRVGIIGLAAVIAGHPLPHEERDRAVLTVGDVELQSTLPMLRRDHRVDLIVVVSHLGFPQDCKLAAVVPGIDVILSGHTHNRLTRPAVINDTVIMQSGAHGSFVGRLDVQVSSQAWPSGITRCCRSTMDNLLLDATAEAAGTEVALSNGWRYGAPIPPGRLTRSDLWSMVHHGNRRSRAVSAPPSLGRGDAARSHQSRVTSRHNATTTRISETSSLTQRLDRPDAYRGAAKGGSGDVQQESTQHRIVFEVTREAGRAPARATSRSVRHSKSTTGVAGVAAAR